MLSSLVLGVALAAPAAPVPRNSSPAPTGPAPWVVYLKAAENDRVSLVVYKLQTVTQTRVVTTVENGNMVAKQVRDQVERLMASTVVLDQLPASFATAQGEPITIEAVAKQAKDGTVVLVSADGKPVDKAWLRAIAPETIVITAQGLASPIAPRPTAQVSTAAPRLTFLEAGKDGRVQVAYNPAPSSGIGNGVIGRGRVVFINNGAGNQPIFLNEDGTFGPELPAISHATSVKPLEAVAFDAYDLSGMVSGRGDVLKRLKAGGLVVIADDNRPPDPAFLKLFRGDLVVLISSELANIPVKGSKPTVAQEGAAPIGMAPLAVPVRVRALAAPGPAIVPVPKK